MPRLSFGAARLLSFIDYRSGKNGYCWWKQKTLAEEFGCDVRTIGRWVRELCVAGKLNSERKGHINHYFVVKSQAIGKLTGYPVDFCGKLPQNVRSDRTKMSDRGRVVLITEIKKEKDLVVERKASGSTTTVLNEKLKA